jgi:hypothetical protein
VFLLVAAVLCIPLAFILPKTNWGIQDQPEPAKPAARSQDEKSQSTGEARPPAEVRLASQGYIPPPPPKKAAPKTKPGPQRVNLLLPGETDERIKALAFYLSDGNSAERDEAYRELLRLDKELVSRLPKLIEKSEMAVGYFADAACDLKASNATDALIAKLQANGISAGDRPRIYRALASFGAPKAHEFVWSALRNPNNAANSVIWPAVGDVMTESDAKEALQITGAGGPDCFLAGAALAKYASIPQKAEPLVKEIEWLMRDKDDRGRLSLATALAAMDESVMPALVLSARDTNQDVRAVAVAGLARNASTCSITIQALRTDSSPVVKNACAQAFALHPRGEALQDMIKLLTNPEVGSTAHETLVRIAGVDFGMNVPKWQTWLASHKAAKH